MRVESTTSFSPDFPHKNLSFSAGDKPFGAMFQEARKKEDSSVRMMEQEDGSFKMTSAEAVIKQEKEGDAVFSEVSLETDMIQAMVTSASFVFGQAGDLSAGVAREVRSFLGLPSMVIKDAPSLPIRIRFEKSPQGLVVVIHLHGAALTELATQQRSVLQNKLSDLLDRSVMVRFLDSSGFEQILEENRPQQSGFGQGRQGTGQDQRGQSFAQADEDDEVFGV
jgi:hypothetical protein